MKLVGTGIVAVVLLSGCSFPWQKDRSQTDKAASEAAPANEAAADAGSDATVEEALPQSNVVVIMDASAGMNAEMDGKTKLDIAKSAVGKIMDKASRNTNVSVLTYGQQGSLDEKDKEMSCNGIDETYFFGKNNPEAVKSKVGSVKSGGYAPLAKALEKAESIVAAHPKDESLILLVAGDGESCGGDVAAITKTIGETSTPVYVISLDTPDETLADLTGLVYGTKNAAFFNVMKEGDVDSLIESESINTNALRPDVAPIANDAPTQEVAPVTQ